MIGSREAIEKHNFTLNTTYVDELLFAMYVFFTCIHIGTLPPKVSISISPYLSFDLGAAFMLCNL